MNKNELANKIRGIDGLTNDEKSALIGLLRKQKKYGLVWEDKPEDVEERLREELPVLIEDTGKAIISGEAGAPNHILIEGDNLEALTALAYTHEGQIDVIYIDRTRRTATAIPNGCRSCRSVCASPNGCYRTRALSSFPLMITNRHS